MGVATRKSLQPVEQTHDSGVLFGHGGEHDLALPGRQIGIAAECLQVDAEARQGVRISWPASEVKRRADCILASSSSSIPLRVVVSSATSRAGGSREALVVRTMGSGPGGASPHPLQAYECGAGSQPDGERGDQSLAANDDEHDLLGVVQALLDRREGLQDLSRGRLRPSSAR